MLWICHYFRSGIAFFFCLLPVHPPALPSRLCAFSLCCLVIGALDEPLLPFWYRPVCHCLICSPCCPRPLQSRLDALSLCCLIIGALDWALLSFWYCHFGIAFGPSAHALVLSHSVALSQVLWIGDYCRSGIVQHRLVSFFTPAARPPAPSAVASVLSHSVALS